MMDEVTRKKILSMLDGLREQAARVMDEGGTVEFDIHNGVNERGVPDHPGRVERRPSGLVSVNILLYGIPGPWPSEVERERSQ